MAPIPESGQLETHPLPVLLLELRRERFGGTLALSRDRTHKQVLFQDGVPIFAESNVPSESLGLQLLDAGAISRENHAQISQAVQERGCKEGAVLLELGLLAPKDLFLALKEQVRRRIVECFGWPAGEFRLEPARELPDDIQPLRTDPIGLVLEGLERHWPPDRILAQLGRKLDLYPVPAPGFAGLQRRLATDPALEGFLAALDGSATLGEALQQATSAAVLAAAWTLDAAGALDYRNAPPGDGKEAPAEEPAPVEIVFEDEARSAPPAEERAAGRPAAGAPGTGSSPAIEALRNEVVERHRKLPDLDHYGVLGVSREADPGAIRRAYFAAAKRYHPDALASLGLEEVRTEATALFARIAKAYATLSDPESRRNYDAELDGHVAADADRLANAEALFRKGEILLRAGDFRGALQFLQPAVQLWPEDPAYQSACGWALFKKTPPELEEARQHLERAVELAADDATALFRLGVVLRELGEAEAVERCQRRARDLDPTVTGR